MPAEARVARPPRLGNAVLLASRAARVLLAPPARLRQRACPGSAPRTPLERIRGGLKVTMILKQRRQTA